MSGVLELLVWPTLIGAFVGVYALRRHASLAGLITLSVVAYGLFAIWLIQGTEVLRVIDALLGESGTLPWWRIALYLSVSAVIIFAGAWLGWTRHRKMFAGNRS